LIATTALRSRQNGRGGAFGPNVTGSRPWNRPTVCSATGIWPRKTWDQAKLVSSLAWVWLFDPTFGLINKALSDLGLIDKPIQFLGVDTDMSTWSVIASVVWKVLGFGMILFVAAIQSIPSDINEATMVDGASFWQRTRRVTLPLTRGTILLVTLVSVIGSLLAFDQFYIMTAGQPFNQTSTAVFYVYLNSFPYLHLGYGAALSLIIAAIILVFTIVQMMLTRRSRI